MKPYRTLLLLSGFLLAGCIQIDSESSHQSSSITISSSGSNSGAEPTSVYIYSVKASPDNEESIAIKNNSGNTVDISGWTLTNSDNSVYTIPAGTTILNGAFKTYSHVALVFLIKDAKETIYLKNASGAEVHKWRN